MATKPVRIEGMDKLLRKLDNVSSLRSAKRALKAGAIHIKGVIAVYPPSDAANSPSNVDGRWYERGYGPRWRRKRDGTVGGYKTSETLGKKWTTQEKKGGLQQVIGNNVSYGGWVQSDEKQSKVMAGRGWITDEQAIEQEGDTVLGFVKDEIDKDLERSY